MNIVKVRNVEIGAGVPKICVPIVGITKEEIITEAKSFDSDSYRYRYLSDDTEKGNKGEGRR